MDELGHFDRLKLGCQKSAAVLAVKVLIQISSHANHLVSLGLSKDILAIDTLRAPERGPTAATVNIYWIGVKSNDRCAQSGLQATSWSQVTVSRYKQSISRSKALREALTINGEWNVNDAASRYNAYFTALLILVNGHKQQIYEYSTLAFLLRIWT